MKISLVLCLFMGLFINATSAEETAKLKFQTYSGYFVSNKFEPDSPASFVVLDNRKQFDQVFGVAFVIGDKSPRLAPDAFETRLVLAAIRRGKAFCTYQISSVTEKEGVVHLRYQTTSKKSDSATFACPLILSIPKGKYQAVEFHENDKLVKRLAIVGK
ncbi:MAG: hypothetical protein VCA18_01035 [Opitutales bacterium]